MRAAAGLSSLRGALWKFYCINLNIPCVLGIISFGMSVLFDLLKKLCFMLRQ